ncbi:glycosyltransferase family 2 protein, partial [Methanoculleus sp. MH98A]|uniref:glycosyltransferase n=1 Tax=Methanoculleus sp. MH98A TaxID=1495314 RepID=UPI001E4BB7F2
MDDGSTDRTSDIATLYQTKYENVIALSKPNGGKASAQNHGLRSARGKYVLVTDADAVVNRDWVSRMVRHLQYYDMVIGACYAKNPKSWLEKVQNARYLIKYKYGGVMGIPSTGVNNAFKKEIIDIVGGFNEGKTSVTSDFIKRGEKKGLKVHYDPNIYVYTKCASSIRGFLGQKLRWREAGTSNLLSFGYTYGLSLFLFTALLLSLYQKEVGYILFALVITYMLSFSAYLAPFYKMLIKREDRYFAAYFLLYEFVELGVRL